VFVSPWVIGVTAFFILPLISAGIYMFNSVKVVPGGIETKYLGLANIKEVFLNDSENVRLILSTLGSTLLTSVLIIVFSLVVALMLHKKFPTKTFVRMLYMLPVIMTSGIIVSVFKQDLFAASAIQGSDAALFQSGAVREMLFSIGLSEEIVLFLTGIVNQILEIVWRSGVQILLFYASLKSIPAQYYEVGKVEGATAWQAFWNITFPVLSSFLVLYSIYTVIDSFMYVENPVMVKILHYFNLSMYEYSTILAVFYSVGVLLVALLIWAVTSRIGSAERPERDKV